ncbi:hypothetical protein WA026_011281 [Henosepilachna vigintioctopunctata]|uniref:Guanylate cyclase domain-containing protein n=1 Tax=Henosepilachna vigintioctopunctata TaxID=420089 RepID=A0AAW1U5F4_9CUCU
MQRIELNEPLEYLTELRQVTVIMINIVPETMAFEELIKLVRAVFRIITIRIQKLSGCINKVSCFDKDLMCVIIFGLRGFKQNMECCNALKCAGLIHADVCVLPKVKSISIGVSTGKTYCGVFGHSLRREYTVIGLTVNKAARLMVAYPGKVTCCNDTFINSKMKETFFEQQKYIYLKGIKNPGPVYEFKYSLRDKYETMKGPVYPILGREEELQLYRKLMNIFSSLCRRNSKKGNLKDVYIKMLVVEGEATIGKTRLIEEFLNITPSTVSAEVISVTPELLLSNYVIKQIFFSGMGISMKALPNMKQENLKMFLSDYPKQHLLCALNDIFTVNFPSCEEYDQYTDYTKVLVRGEIMRHLADAVFTTPKVIIIDNMHLMDDAISWQLIRDLLKALKVFVVGTIRTGKENRSKFCKWIFKSKRVHFLRLKKINEMYYAALACQMIHVEAISPDLENVIQKMSNGIAGWIKNFLICLQQADAITIKPMTYEDIYKHGLVSPALYMMKRLNKEDLATWKKIMEEKSDQSAFDSSDHWIKYVDSCRDAVAEIEVRNELRNIFKQGKEVQVCITAPDFERFTELSEQSQEILIIRTFDSLLYTEQLVAKCGSVLGWQFSRNMLEYVVGDLCSDREKAEAIQKLFEHRIFGCSRGDFTEIGEYVIIRNSVSKNNENQPIECNCLALNIPDSCADLPKYASCGYIHFISTSFLEATYNLLPEAQKIEFHMRAGRYLEKNTRRCRACGNGYFEEFTGKKEKLLKTVNKRFFAIRKFSQDDDQSRASDNTSTHGGSLAISAEITSFSVDYSYADKARFDSLGFISPKTVYNLKERVSLTRTFSMYDFTNCECKLILNYMYGEVSRHFKVAGQYDMMLKAMLAYAKSCINLDNIAEALTTLDVAEKHLKQRGISSEEPHWKLNLLMGNIFTLRGKALLEMNQLDESSKYLFMAMENYEAPFPVSNFKRSIKSSSKKLKQKLALYVLPGTFTKKLRYYEEMYFNDVAVCLNTMSQVFRAMGRFKQNELAAIWALECALKADCDFTLICQCFKDMIYIAQMNRNTFHCLALEVHSLRYCHKKIYDIHSDDVKYVAELYHVIRELRLNRSELEKSVYIGYIALRLAISVNHYKLILKSIPPLICTLLLKSYLPEVCSLINELDYYTCDSDCNSVESGRLFFHIACLRFHIETGYTVIFYEDIEKFNYSENLQLAGVKNPAARIEFISLMWLWNCRNRRWVYITKWKKDIQYYVDELLLEGKHYAPFAVMYILEGYLLSFVHSINSQSISTHLAMTKTINNLFKTLETKRCSLILPRLKHFEAYYEFIKGNDEKALKILEETLICAAKYENTLELIHANHSKLAWTDQLSSDVRDKWRAHSDSDRILSYRMLDGYDDEIISFTLPKPLYVI